MDTRFDNTAILAIAIAVLASLTHFGHFTSGNAFDYYQFWMFGQAAHQSAPDNIYSQDQRNIIGEKYYQQAKNRPGSSARHRQVAELRKDAQAISTPLLYTYFGLLSSGRFESDFLDYQLIATLCAIAAIFLLCRAMQYSWTSACLWLVCLFVWFGSFFSEVEVGNVNRIQLLIIALFVWLQARQNCWARDLIGGILLSLMITFKPNTALVPLLLLIAWLIDGQFARLGRSIIGITLGAAAAVALSAWHFGSAHCWIDWIKAINETRQNMQQHGGGNFSLSWFFTGRFGFETALPFIGALMAVACVAIFLGRSKLPAIQRDIALVTAGIAIALLGAPLTWHHYFLLASPLWIMLFEPDARFPGPMRVIGIIVLLAVSIDHLVGAFIIGASSFPLKRGVMWLIITLPLIGAIATIARPTPKPTEPS